MEESIEKASGALTYLQGFQSALKTVATHFSICLLNQELSGRFRQITLCHDCHLSELTMRLVDFLLLW